MAIESGTRLGPYEIVSPLGAGGMGEVFRARDTRLDRSVAIKVLPAEFAENASLKARFEREAKTISQLEHPNICRLYDVGEEVVVGAHRSAPAASDHSAEVAGPRLHASAEASRISYLVMELLEGESLADRLARGPLAVADVLRYGVQIADALATAHRVGIVHRDLKPGNIMLTKSGAKLLDFGLAKSTTALSGAASPATSLATAARPLTEQGTILGTFQYMAPEQLEGEEADARTDIFALGVVLYEMLTGKRAFEGKTRVSLIAAIVDRDPQPVSQLQPLTPPSLEHVIMQCLAKAPDERWQSAHDIAEGLRWIGSAGSQAGVAVPLTSKRKRRERLAWLLHLVTAAAAVALTWMVIEMRRPPSQPVESVILPPEKLTFRLVQGAMALAPDGSRIAFLAGEGQAAWFLFVRPLASGVARQLAGTEGAQYPFWSPDGRQIGFFADGKLKTIDQDGGPVSTLCDAPASRGGSWGANGMIAFTPSPADPIYIVPATGGPAKAVTRLSAGESTHRWPFFLPDGRRFLFVASGGGSGEAGIYVGSIEGNERKRLITQNSSVAYASPGYLIFIRDRSLVAQRFDARSLEVTGAAFPLAERIAASRGQGIFSVSNRGNLVYQKGNLLAPTQLVWVDRQGKEIGSLGPPALFFSPRISHDGRRVAVDISAAASGLGDIWIFDLIRNVSSRLTYNAANESGPVWSADDREITFHSDRNGPPNLFRISSGGTGQEETVYESAAGKLSTDSSRDGRWLVFASTGNRNTGTDIWTYSIAEKKATPWLVTPFAESGAILSPDGKWITYQSNESGRNEIYVRNFPESREKVLVSSAGGRMPAWRGDGRELYYISPERKMMAVPVTLTPTLEAGAPAPLFEVNVLGHTSIKQYDVSSDGTRFLLNRISRDEENEPITLVQNWPARLKNP